MTTDVSNPVSDVFRMHPNPATEVVHFSFAGSTDEKVTVTLFDTKGRMVVREVFSSHTSLNTSTLEAGVYVVNCKTDNLTQVIKLVIE